MSQIFNAGNGIFRHMPNAPWSNQLDPIAIDTVYHLSHSGQKWCSPFTLNYVNVDTYSISDDDISNLASIILSVYSVNWKKLWDAINADYNITDNYNITETYDESGSENGKDSNTYTKSQTTVDNGKNVNHDESTGSETASNDTSVYGFNSESPSKSETVGDTNTSSNTGDSTLTKENTSKFIADDSDSGTKEKSYTNEHSVTKKGNIGVMTYQSMLKSEIDVREWQYFEQIFQDVDSLLTLSTY